MINAVLLDLFGTIVDYTDWAESLRTAGDGIYGVLKDLGASMPYEEFANYWLTRFFVPLSAEEDIAETPFLGKILRLFRLCGLSGDLVAAGRAARDCIADWEAHLYLPADTIPTLRALHQRYALALVSNFDHPPYVAELLERHDLAQYLDYVVVSGAVRIDKPDPRIYRLALDALSCAPEEALFVGDTLETDIAGANTVGCHAVLIDTKDAHPQYAGQRIRRLSELLPLLEGCS
jgi:putative hydrolase of the HAD superfamily